MQKIGAQATLQTASFDLLVRAARLRVDKQGAPAAIPGRELLIKLAKPIDAVSQLMLSCGERRCQHDKVSAGPKLILLFKNLHARVVVGAINPHDERRESREVYAP
jgi:hypothetical protein